MRGGSRGGSAFEGGSSLFATRNEGYTYHAYTFALFRDSGAHGGMWGAARNVQSLRTTWFHAVHCRPRRGLFENEVAILTGSNSEFLKEAREMAMWLDVERLYLSKNYPGALKLLPLLQIGPAPKSAKNACYFFNRLEHGEARFVSYHYTDQPELKGQFNEATEMIKLLTSA